MTYTQQQVLEVLRKHPISNLWNYEHRKWNERQKAEFEELKTGIKKPKKIQMQRTRNPGNTDRSYQMKKVIRVSDGKPYNSIKECAEDNYLSEATISRSVNGNHKEHRFIAQE